MLDNLGDRMKGFEEASKAILPRRLPIILRLDGKAFHTYTKSMPDRPFNRKMMHVMEMTAIEVCRQIQGAQLAYVQSDEISVLIHSYKTLNSQSWFDDQLQKMVSVASGIASATFTMNSWKIWRTENQTLGLGGNAIDLGDIKPAFFDARAFVLPESEVCNYFVWRQQDARRNSVSGHARSLFSHKQCNKKNTDEMKQMCSSVGKPWETLTTSFRQGRVVHRVVANNNQGVVRSRWEVDNDTPLFQTNRNYIEAHLKTEE